MLGDDGDRHSRIAGAPHMLVFVPEAPPLRPERHLPAASLGMGGALLIHLNIYSRQAAFLRMVILRLFVCTA